MELGYEGSNQLMRLITCKFLCIPARRNHTYCTFLLVTLVDIRCNTHLFCCYLEKFSRPDAHFEFYLFHLALQDMTTAFASSGG
jgi:hypothetical protein